MAIPVLKKLRSQRLSSGRAADLLEKHIGIDANEVRCIEALEAIPRIKSRQIRKAAEVISLILPDGATPCERVRAVILQIRGELSP